MLPTGRDILLGVLSLMARSFDDNTLMDKKIAYDKQTNGDLLGVPDRDKPNLAYEYSVEISVQLFQSLLMILTVQSEELFEADDVDNSTEEEQNGYQNGVNEVDDDGNGGNKFPCLRVDKDWSESGVLSSSSSSKEDKEPARLPKSLMTWAILRCTLSILRSNLNVLNDLCAADHKKETALQGLLNRHLNKAESKLFDMNNHLSDILSPSEEASKGSLSASGRLASLLGVSMTSNCDEYDGLRSSEDEEEEDEDEDDDDDDDEENSSDKENSSDEEDEEDCDDEDMHEDNILEHLHDDEYEDDDMDVSNDLLDEEADKLARAVISMMEGDCEGGESDHDQDQDQSYEDEYDLGKDLYDNEEEEAMDLNLEEDHRESNMTERNNEDGDVDDDGNNLNHSDVQKRDSDFGGGNNDSESSNNINNESEHGQMSNLQEQDQDEVTNGKNDQSVLTDSESAHALGDHGENGINSSTQHGLSPAASHESLELNSSFTGANAYKEDGMKVGGVRLTEEEKNTDDADEDDADADEQQSLMQDIHNQLNDGHIHGK
jgi:hypothetical protein